MDNSRSSLPNVDRANSTLFKRYLEEQHRSIVKANTHQAYSRPNHSTFQIQQEEIHSIHSKTHYPTVLVKRKNVSGKRPSGDLSKQRTSHTSRFMRRFQRQYKQGDTMHHVQRPEGRARFEFHPPLPTINEPMRTEKDAQCTCLTTSHQQREHPPRSPLKSTQVPRLSLNEPSHLLSQQSKHFVPTSSSSISSFHQLPIPISVPLPARSPLSTLPPTMDESNRQESISVAAYPVGETPLPTSFIIDPVLPELPDDYYILINGYLQELSFELTDKPSVDILLEIEGSLAQRIYDCVVEHDEENEQETNSYSTTIADSSSLSVPVNKSNDLQPSPIPLSVKETKNHHDKYFQPIREEPTPTFNRPTDQNRQSTLFNQIPKQFGDNGSSPFVQSLFEPVNLLRTVATNPNSNDNDDWNFLSDTFVFDTNSENLPFPSSQSQHRSSVKANERSTIASSHQTMPFSNTHHHHLLLPRTASVETTQSAFKPLDQHRSTTGFNFKRPALIGPLTATNWFGQS